MKIDFRLALLLLIIGFISNFIFKTSGVGFLMSLDFLTIVFIVLISLQSGFIVNALFIVFSVILDLVLFQPVGYTIAAVFVAYLIVNIFNKIFSISKKPGLVFNLIVLTVSIFFNSMLLVSLEGQDVVVNPLSFIIIIIMFIIAQSLITKVTSIRNAY